MNRCSLLAVLAVTLVGCGPEVSARAESSTRSDSTLTPAPIVESPRVAPENGVPALPASLPAVLFSDLDAETAARMNGVVREVRAELGDAVREGEVLLVLDDAREVARVESATAALELARATFTRIESLLAKNLVTPAQMDEARFAVRAAEASLREAQVEFEHTRLVAPFTGVITRRMAGRGRSVREGEPLFRLTALQPLRALVRLPERDARGLRLNAPVLLQTEDGQQIAASIQRISPATDAESGTVEVLLAVPRPGPL